ncbi:SGS domain-containing protein [Melampsora americana]|nr:SGS domain-containing protein [Melampsora americana]
MSEHQPTPKIRHEWYQTDSEVVVSIFIKNTKPEELQVDLQPKSLTVNYALQAGSEGCFALDPLRHEIQADQSSWRSLSSKIELKLKKKTAGVKWDVIEGDEGAEAVPTATIQPAIKAEDHSSAYPSSSRRKTNWDQLAKTVEKEEEEDGSKDKDPNAGGDVALNKLFQKLYGDASDEQKRAMMKSYTESNGTSLSTDWNEVKKSKVETRPPSSMEVKNWEK